MNTWIRRSLNTGALAAGALLALGTAAHAGPNAVTSDNFGILNGTQVLLPVQIPVDVCGVAIGVIGNAQAGCVGGSTATLNPEWTSAHYSESADTSLTSDDNFGILNGNQVYAPTQVPINICGVAVGVVGDAQAGCAGGASAAQGGRHDDNRHYQHDNRPGKHDNRHGYGHDCKPGQNKITVPAKVAGYDKDAKRPACTDDGHGGKYGKHHWKGADEGGRASDVKLVTQGNFGILNGNQAYAPIQVPINVCGVAVGIIGNANAGCVGGSSAVLHG